MVTYLLEISMLGLDQENEVKKLIHLPGINLDSQTHLGCSCVDFTCTNVLRGSQNCLEELPPFSPLLSIDVVPKILTRE